MSRAIGSTKNAATTIASGTRQSRANAVPDTARARASDIDARR
jgi:hypothetical protein